MERAFNVPVKLKLTVFVRSPACCVASCHVLLYANDGSGFAKPPVPPRKVHPPSGMNEGTTCVTSSPNSSSMVTFRCPAASMDRRHRINSAEMSRDDIMCDEWWCSECLRVSAIEEAFEVLHLSPEIGKRSRDRFNWLFSSCPHLTPQVPASTAQHHQQIPGDFDWKSCMIDI